MDCYNSLEHGMRNAPADTALTMNQPARHEPRPACLTARYALRARRHAPRSVCCPRKTTARSDQATSSDTESFTLDAVSNRIAHSKVSGEWIYDANDRLTQRGAGTNAATYQFDAAGSLTSKAESGRITRYFYDTQNRLVEIQDNSNNPIARYGYDPLNRRIWKEQYRHANGDIFAQAVRTYYLYADEGLITEAIQAINVSTDASVTASATPQIATQYGPKPNAPFTTGTLFIKTKNSNGQPTVAYYHHDHLNTPLQATDKAGTIVWAARYNAFGAATIITPAATTEKPTITSNLRLPGQYEDEESNLHYNWHRYYDVATGRYATADPIGLVGGINTYAYAVVYG